MQQRMSLNWLVPLLAVLAFVGAAMGLWWPTANDAVAAGFVTLRGQTVTLFGQGVYAHDTVFSAAGFKGMDAVTLSVALPLLLVSFRSYRRGSLRGGLVLTGALTYFVYIGASLVFSAAFNQLFLLYTALFSASLFALIYAVSAVDLPTLARQVSPALPRRALAVFLLVAGLGTLLLWLSDLVGPLLAGSAPDMLGPYTTMFTYGFDSAVITPAAVVAGLYVRQRKPVGYLLAAPVLILCTLNGVVVIAATIAQTLAGIRFPMAVYVGMIGSWVVMGAAAVWLALVFFRGLAEPAPRHPASTSSRPTRAAA